ncbi:SecD/SecF fusion protein [Daejeonella rubra]|uniref:Multifunctional fusion protein n=1 Tax=Daejeonella rubra TaxID=990371 RepID=A0A1G9QHZ0_9SPHI|nr:protein translocase subunit SecDF [Daejeonella rubra]SDM10500.1 SecD/SecF fusion protein [Daejeonella rubra]
MQGKGLIKFAAIALTIACLYSLSFTWIANKVEKDAQEFAKGDALKEKSYLDSVASLPVFGSLDYITYQYAKEREIPLGLDLKGGMNVTMEISLSEMVRNLANNSTDANFNAAIKNAELALAQGDNDFISAFGREFEKVSPNTRLATIFATKENSANLKVDADNKTVLDFLRKSADGAIDLSFNILRTRIDKFGVTSPNIQKQQGTNRILIELPGVTDPDRVRKLLQGSAKLEFWETYDNTEIFGLLQNVNSILATTVKSVDTTNAAAQDTSKSKLAALGKKDSSSTDSAAIKSKLQAEQAKQNPLFALLNPATFQGQDGQSNLRPGPVVGYAALKDTAKVNAYLSSPAVRAVIPQNIKLYWGVKAISEESKVFELYALKTSSIAGGPALEGDVISDARSDYDQKGNPEVVMVMNTDGARAWRTITAAASADPNNKRSVAIVLDNLVYSAPTVQGEIPNGISSISGSFKVEDTQDLANVLKAGRLPAPAKIVSDYVVGPSLGAASISAGLLSTIAGIIFILIFMGMYYSTAGLVANIALLVNLFFLMGVLASLGAVLTLPGIAGIVLSLGMSVDANVLIYERIREEIAEGKSVRLAITEGFRKAMPSILDSNITTFLTGVILYIFGQGPIVGFATTLMIGIITSLFAAIFISRLVFEWLLDRKKPISFSIKATENLFKDSKFDFITGRKRFYFLSAAIIVAGIISAFTQGFSLGVDFQGGRAYFVAFDKPVEVENVRSILIDEFGTAVEVKTFGTSNQVKITTAYLINDNSDQANAQVNEKLASGLKKINPVYEIKDSQKVTPTIADDIKKSAIWAVIFSILVIFLYILVRFRRMAFGFAAILALVHDVLVLLAIFTIFNGWLPFSLDIDQAFVAAILTVMGYSINDTVVVFDRVREYIGQHHSKNEDLPSVINNALNSTLSRTVITGICTIAVLLIIFIFGGEILRGFSFAMLIGVIFGTYSSLFVATPFVVEFIKEKGKA